LLTSHDLKNYSDSFLFLFVFSSRYNL